MQGTDVKNLFRSFGESSERYEELDREHEAGESRQRWPLLQSISAMTKQSDSVPAVPTSAAMSNNSQRPQFAPQPPPKISVSLPLNSSNILSTLQTHIEQPQQTDIKQIMSRIRAGEPESITMPSSASEAQAVNTPQASLESLFERLSRTPIAEKTPKPGATSLGALFAK
jgi:Cellulose biosynthesis protein BcsR-like